MAEMVIKRNGSKEPFDEEKIRKSIEAAAESAGLSEERVSEVTEEVLESTLDFVKEKDELATSEIRTHILSQLDELEPSVSAEWRDYDSSIKGQ